MILWQGYQQKLLNLQLTLYTQQFDDKEQHFVSPLVNQELARSGEGHILAVLTNVTHISNVSLAST